MSTFWGKAANKVAAKVMPKKEMPMEKKESMEKDKKDMKKKPCK